MLMQSKGDLLFLVRKSRGDQIMEMAACLLQIFGAKLFAFRGERVHLLLD